MLVADVQHVMGVTVGQKPYHYGPQTEEAVKRFQQEHGLKADGVVGYKTLLKMAPSIKLTANFTLYEFIHSSTAVSSNISNMPNEIEYASIISLANTMQRVRNLLGHPITITSGFRGLALNSAVGGSRTSAHRYGLAADFRCPGFGSTPAVVEAIHKADIGYDQLILEHPGTSGSWVHLGLRQTGERRQNLTALKRNGRTVYVEGFQY